MQIPISIVLPSNNDSILTLKLTHKVGRVEYENGGKLVYSLPVGGHTYLSSKMSSNFQTLPERDLFGLSAGTDYMLSCRVETTGSMAQLWLIEYSDEGNLGGRKYFLKDGVFSVMWRTSAEHSSLCLALRLTGQGELQLQNLQLSLSSISGAETPIIENSDSAGKIGGAHEQLKTKGRGVIVLAPPAEFTNWESRASVAVDKQAPSLRLIIPVDSRVSDSAGLIFLDTGRNISHSIPVETSGCAHRNGFRGGCLVGSDLFVCTSSQVMRLAINWPMGGMPTVRTDQVIRRPEWEIGARANADLHHIYYDSRNDRLLVANSYMDCIDFIDIRGEFKERRYLWDISDEILDFSYDRKNGIADLCHINNIGVIGDEIVLTLGNLNGSRLGALMSLHDGRIIAKGLAFPHDGVQTSEGFWVTEAENQSITLFKDASSLEDLTVSRRTRIQVPMRQLSGEETGRIWVRGLRVTKNYILAGCSQFDHQISTKAESEQSHIVVLDKSSFDVIGRIPIFTNGVLKSPVIYSIFVLNESES